LLTLPSIIAALALLVAGGALLRARAAAQRAARLSESYWELKYESGQTRARLNRLEAATGLREAEPDADAAASRPAQTTTFVPLSSLKK
jgi:hypothetical protein